MRQAPNPELYGKLKRGQAIRITFGGAATQLAVVHKVTRAGNVHVFKYSATPRIWKGPIRLYEGEVIELLDKVALTGIRALPDAYNA